MTPTTTPQTVCIHQKVCQLLVYNGSHTHYTFSNHADHSFQPLQKHYCSNSERVCKHIHLLKSYSCLNNLSFQPYYKTIPKTYAPKMFNVPFYLNQLFEPCPLKLSRTISVINCILRAWNGQCLLHRTHQHLFYSLSHPG